MEKSKILVTGAAGFIGYHLCLRLLSENYEVVGLDNINDYYDVRVKYGRLQRLGIAEDSIQWGAFAKSSSQPNFSFVRANLEDKATIDKIFAENKFEKVCNLAAQAGVRYSLTNPEAYIQSNIVGFLNILEACRNFGVKSLSYASSSSVYGLNKKQPFSTSDNVDHPVSLYAASKKSNELMAHTYSHLYGLSTTGLRFFTVYGPWGRPDMALFLFTKAILENKPIDVYNFGKMERDFTYIDDIVEGIFRVIENPAVAKENWNPQSPDPSCSTAPYRVYNIGNSSPVKLMDFIAALEKKLGIEAEKNFLPLQAGDVPATWADTQDLQKTLFYKPSTDIQTGINRFVDWYRQFFGV